MEGVEILQRAMARAHRSAQTLVMGLVCAALAFGALGCVTNTEGKRMWTEINTLKETQRGLAEDRARLSQTLERSQADIDRLQEVIEQARDLLGRNSADLGAEMIEVKRAVDQLSGELETSKRNLAELQQEFNLFRKDVDDRLVSGAASSATLPDDKDALWDEAQRRFDAKKWSPARAAFERFLGDHGRDKRADNAQYLIGETYRREGLDTDAILAYRKVLKFRKSDVEDAAVYRSAQSFVKLGQCDNARALYESFLREYPRSKHHSDAKREFKDLKSRGCP